MLLVRHRYGLRRDAVSGGVVEPDQTPQQAAVREAWEKVGVEIESEGASRLRPRS